MYYNVRTQEILEKMPLNGYFENGTLVQGLDLSDPDTQKLCGILPIKTMTPQPENTSEDVSQRQVVIEEDGVNITCIWIPLPVSIPTISPRQIRLWLVNHNISLSSVDAAINGIQDQMLKEKTLIEWQYSPYIERNHSMVNTIGSALGLSSEQIDQAFMEASLL